MSLDAAYPPVIESAPPAARGRVTGSAVAAAVLVTVAGFAGLWLNPTVSAVAIPLFAANLAALFLLTGLLRR